MQTQKLLSEDNISSRRMQGKRLLATHEGCKFDLRDELPKLFRTFSEALTATNQELLKYNPMIRCKTLEASIMQTFIAQKLQEYFPGKTFFGKYRRLVMRVNGYLLLFKKLNSKGYPMNIKTQNVQSILNQQQTLDLFSNSDYNDEPILYFGYQKNRFGEYVNPQLVYIDENNIRFSINVDNFGDEIALPVGLPKQVTPGLRNSNSTNKQAK